MRRMSTKTHGIIDYLTSATLLALPKLLGWDTKTTAIVSGSGGAAALYSAMTDYELGAVRMLPMKAHLTLDALSGGMLLGAALLMDDEEPEVRSTIAGIGLFEIAASLLTETQPRHSSWENSAEDQSTQQEGLEVGRSV